MESGEHDCPSAPHIARVYAWGWHSGPLRKAVHRLKYQRDIALGERLSQHLAEVLTPAALEDVAVAPVPLWPGRQRQRGYNQAALLASPLAYALGLEYVPQVVRRRRNTPSQVGLSLLERRENVAGAFVADPDKVKGRKILLVDDVLTTGSTLNAAAEALRLAGADRVVAVVLARARSARNNAV